MDFRLAKQAPSIRQCHSEMPETERCFYTMLCRKQYDSRFKARLPIAAININKPALRSLPSYNSLSPRSSGIGFPTKNVRSFAAGDSDGSLPSITVSKFSPSYLLYTTIHKRIFDRFFDRFFDGIFVRTEEKIFDRTEERIWKI